MSLACTSRTPRDTLLGITPEKLQLILMKAPDHLTENQFQLLLLLLTSSYPSYGLFR